MRSWSCSRWLQCEVPRTDEWYLEYPARFGILQLHLLRQGRQIVLASQGCHTTLVHDCKFQYIFWEISRKWHCRPVTSVSPSIHPTACSQTSVSWSNQSEPNSEWRFPGPGDPALTQSTPSRLVMHTLYAIAFIVPMLASSIASHFFSTKNFFCWRKWKCCVSSSVSLIHNLSLILNPVHEAVPSKVFFHGRMVF